MLKKNVPQDGGILDRWHEISYAIDDDGSYVLAPSVGWEPANLANKQAWELISKQVADVIKRIHAQELSPLAYYMVKNQMDTNLLGYQPSGQICPPVSLESEVASQTRCIQAS
jgi:hypothetical protein